MTRSDVNREVWTLLKDSVNVAVPDRERVRPRHERVRVVGPGYPSG